MSIGITKPFIYEQADQIIRDAQNDARRAVDELNKEEFEVRRRLEEIKRLTRFKEIEIHLLIIVNLLKLFGIKNTMD